MSIIQLNSYLIASIKASDLLLRALFIIQTYNRLPDSSHLKLALIRANPLLLFVYEYLHNK